MRSSLLWTNIASLLMLGACQARQSPVDPGPAMAPSAQAIAHTADGATLLAGFRIDLDPETLAATVTPHRTGTAQPPQGQRYDLDIANFQNAGSLRITGVQVLGSGNFRLTFTHAHPFPAPNVANPPTGMNRADLGYTGRLLVLTSYNLQPFFSGAVRMSAGAVVAPDGYVEPGDLLLSNPLSLVTAYPYKLLADEAQDNRVGVSNGGTATGNYAAGAGGWQRANLGSSGDGWTGYDYIHGGQTITNQLVLDRTALESSSFTLDAALLIQYTDPRGAGGTTFRLPPASANVTNFAYRLPYAALDGSRVVPTSSFALGPNNGDSAILEVRVRDWDAGASEAADATVGDEADVALVQIGASGAPEVVLDAPGILTAGLRNLGGPTSGTGTSASPFLYSNTLPNQLAPAPGLYYACLRITDPESDDTARESYHLGVDPATLLPSAARAIPARTWQLVPITITAPNPVPVITGVSPNGIVGAVDEPLTFHGTATGSPTAWNWNFGGGTREPLATGASPDVFLAGLPGTYTGMVTATNANGTSAPFGFTFRVLDPVRPDFPMHVLHLSALSVNVSEGEHVLVIDDQPILLYTEFDAGVNVYCAIGNSSNPQDSADWTIHTAATAVGGVLSAAVVEGRPAFMATTPSTDLVPIYGHANQAFPGDASDWVVAPMQAVEPGVNYGLPNNLVELTGRPFAVARSNMSNSLYAYAATTPTPGGAGDWNRHLIASDVTSLDLATQQFSEGERALVLIGENTSDRTRLLLATSAAPGSVADYSPLVVGSEDTGSVSVIGGPVFPEASDIFVATVPVANTQPRIRHLRATSASEVSFLKEYRLPVQATTSTSFPVVLGMHNGRPLALVTPSIFSSSQIWRARRPDPVLSDWEGATLLSPGAASRPSVASLNNRIAVFGDTGDFALGISFGLATGPW